MREELGAGVDRLRVRHWNFEALGQFDDCAYDSFEFDGAAGFEILQH